MTGKSILSSFSSLPRRFRPRFSVRRVRQSQPLHAFWLRRDSLPAWVLRSPVAMRYLDLLGPLPWGQFPERDLHRNYGQPTFPYAVLACCARVIVGEGENMFARDFSEPNYNETSTRDEVKHRVNAGEDALEYIVERVASGAIPVDLAFQIVEDLHEAAHEPMTMCSCGYHLLLADMYVQFAQQANACVHTTA